MAIQDIDTKCYILALFIRDDGERFLLGSGRYEFKDKQRHFAANTMQNDVVEVQGNDGLLLAGQVKRPGSQSFDGYVGDGTTSKQEVEEYRRDFFSFFRKNFFYQVIYIFPDGTAIQRKRGFLVDAPVVQELYQIYPEYHVALNFEDVNYYSYSENASGEEEFAKSATISLSAGGSSGGLVWDELGAVSEGFQWGEIVTATGTEITVQNDSEGALPITDAKIYGDTFQQTYSGKNLLPIENSVTFNGITTKLNDDGTITMSGTTNTAWGWNWMTYQKTLPTPLPAGAYTLSVTEAVQNAPLFGITFWNQDKSTNVFVRIPSGSTSATITLDFDAYYIGGAVTGSPALGSAINQTIGVQLEASSTATAFEPYVGGTASPNPDYPQEVQTVTGRQLVTISNGSTSEEYEINLGDIELCKIGDYQDYIYRSGGEWYLRKEIGHKLVTGSGLVKAIAGTSSSASSQSSNGAFLIDNSNTGVDNIIASSNIGVLGTQSIPNNAGANSMADGTFAQRSGVNDRVYFRNTGYIGKTGAEVEDILLDKSGGADIYYSLTPATDTLITNQALIEDLNGLVGVSFPTGESQLVVSASGNLVGELEISYYGSVDFEGGGFVWEEGGPSGPTTVEVDSIENVYPIWEVKGPATNPQLSVLTTNTTLRYNGTVAVGQTLTIDMMSKTAKLNGTSVIGNVSGEWVNFVPGNNRVVYTTNNANAESSTIYWQEVVG